MDKKLQVAVLVENHPYDVVGFQKMLNSFDDCECYVQPLSLFVKDDDNRAKYDTVLYYNMHIPAPEADDPIRGYMESELGADGQGVILIHHALLSFQRWDLYTELSGVRVRGEGGIFKYTQGQSVDCRVVGGAHPVMAGVGDFSLIDETYIIGEPEEPGNEILVRTDNATSIKNIAWVRQYKESRVFCTASGHDDRVYSHPAYRKMLHNAILWTSRKI